MTNSKIYVRLLDEGLDVWRPIAAKKIGDRTFEIVSQSCPADEIWEFNPGDQVRCRSKEVGGERVLVAHSTARSR
jgi:hypothetical protein